MIVEHLAIPGLLLIKPKVLHDARGRFVETWHQARYDEAGISGPFVQDNTSVSKRGVLRGLHFQHPHGQAKLVTVLEGAVYDVAVDIRLDSPSRGKWVGIELTHLNGWQLYVPTGFAHGFMVLSDSAVFSYKCTDVYEPKYEQSLLWNDPAIGIEWPLAAPVISSKDAAAPVFSAIDERHLPVMAHPHA